MDDFARSFTVKIVDASRDVLSPVDHLAKTQLSKGSKFKSFSKKITE